MTRGLATRWPGRCFADGPVQITECQRMFAPVYVPQRDLEPGAKVDDILLSVDEPPLPHPSWGAQGRGGREETRRAGGLASPLWSPAGCSQGWVHHSVPKNQQGPPCSWGIGKRVLAGQVLAGASTRLPHPEGFSLTHPVRLNVYSEDSPRGVSDPETHFTAKDKGWVPWNESRPQKWLT